MEKLNKLHNIEDNEIFNGKMVIKQYDFFKLGNVKILYPNQEDINYLLEIMLESTKTENDEIEIDIDIYTIVYKIMPLVTNIDVTDVTKDDIQHYVEIGHPELLEVINDISIIIESLTDLFKKVITEVTKK